MKRPSPIFVFLAGIISHQAEPSFISLYNPYCITICSPLMASDQRTRRDHPASAGNDQGPAQRQGTPHHGGAAEPPAGAAVGRGHWRNSRGWLVYRLSDYSMATVVCDFASFYLTDTHPHQHTNTHTHIHTYELYLWRHTVHRAPISNRSASLPSRRFCRPERLCFPPG